MSLHSLIAGQKPLFAEILVQGFLWAIAFISLRNIFKNKCTRSQAECFEFCKQPNFSTMVYWMQDFSFQTKTWTPSFAENIVNKQLTKFLPKMCLRCKESFGSQEWIKNVRQVRAMNTKCRRHSSGLWMNASSFYLLPTYIHRWFKNSLYWPWELGILSDERHNF